MKLLISLYDYTGNWSRPYSENGWNVIQVDIKHGIDIMKWEYQNILVPPCSIVVMLIAQPCTDYALSGAKHFWAKDRDGRTEASQQLVAKTKEVKDYFKPDVWALENPMSRIHKLNRWLGKPRLKFDPFWYAGYDPIPDNSRYVKKTWLWGDFSLPYPKPVEPISRENPGWRNLGGKSERTKELRSITPLGFAYAFYEANH